MELQDSQMPVSFVTLISFWLMALLNHGSSMERYIKYPS